MNAEVKELFEHFCQSKNVFPNSVQEMEALFGEFSKLLKQDVELLFYLNGFSATTQTVLDVFPPLQALLKDIPNLQDPRFVAMRDKVKQLPPKRKTSLDDNLTLYGIFTTPVLKDFQANASQANLLKLIEGFDTGHWLQEIKRVESASQSVDKRFHQVFNKILNDLQKIQGQHKNNPLSAANQTTVIQHLTPFLFQLNRRAELGTRLTQSALNSQLSFLSYVELVTKSEEKWSTILPGSLIISQWDWLHEHKVLHQNLFVSIRKQGVVVVTKELNDRMELVRILTKLLKFQWIDPKQLETILKNSCNQPANKPLSSLQIFIKKKEVGQLVNKLAAGSDDKSLILDRLSTVMKSNDALNAFYQNILGNETDWETSASKVTLEKVRQLLGVPPQKSPTSPSQPFKDMKEKILAPTQSPTPTVESSAKAEEAPPAKEGGGVLSKINELQQQLLKAADVMDEIMSNHYQKEEAIDFVRDKQILFPDTEQFFQRKLQILKKQVKEGLGPDEHPEMLLGKWKMNIRNSLRLDTQLFVLQQKLKTYGNFELNQDELAIIKNPDLPAKERSAMLEECSGKYELLHTLQATASPEQLESVQLSEMSAKLIYSLQDILKSEVNFFTKDELDRLEANLPKTEKGDVKTRRNIIHEFYDAPMRSGLICRLVQWGLWHIEDKLQNKIKDQILAEYEFDRESTPFWKQFKSEPLTKQSLQKAIDYAPPAMQDLMDQKAKKLFSTFKSLTSKDNPNLKLLSPAEIRYFSNSMTTTEYLAKIQNLLNAFKAIEDAPKPEYSATASGIAPPSDFSMLVEEILSMELYDQRLEIILDEITEILPEDSAIVNEGKALYKAFTGFDY